MRQVTREFGLWENTVLLRCNFKFQVFTAPGAGFCIPFCSDVAQAHVKKISGGGGLFNPRGALFRSNFNYKNHKFSDDFPVICWYIHIMLLHDCMTLTSKFITLIGSGMRS